MISLGDVLDLIHSSPDRFRTARLVGRTGNSTWKLWWAGDERYRFEREHARGSSVAVRAGATWWMVEPDGTGHTNYGDSSLGLGMQPELALLHTRSLLSSAILDVLRVEEILGRSAAILLAAPRPGVNWRWWGFEDETEPMEVAIDLERGVALSGFDFRVDEIDLDEEFGPEPFSRPYEGGSPGHDPRAPHPVAAEAGRHYPREVSLEEACRVAAFKVLLPRLLPEGARLFKCLVDPSEAPQWVGLTWAIDPGCRYTLHLRQGPGLAREAEHFRGKEVIEQGMRVLVDAAESHRALHRVLIEKDDCWIEIDSNLPVETLIEIANSLERSA